MSRYVGPVGSFRLSFVSTMVDAAMKAPASAESYAHISELFIFFLCSPRALRTHWSDGDGCVFVLRRWLGEVACETKADEVCR